MSASEAKTAAIEAELQRLERLQQMLAHFHAAECARNNPFFVARTGKGIGGA